MTKQFIFASPFTVSLTMSSSFLASAHQYAFSTISHSEVNDYCSHVSCPAAPGHATSLTI
jgi:hypothetical protein